jgi:hypothetical protein
MRLTMKVAAAGDVYLGRFPMIPVDLAEWKNADDTLNIGRVRYDLREYEEFIQFSSDDSARTIAFTIEFLRQIGCVSRSAAADPEVDARVEAEKPIDHSLMRKMDRDKYGYCRLDIDVHRNAIRVRVGIANPKGVVGNVALSCRRFAVDCARILLFLQCGFKGVCEVELIGRGDLADLFDEARWTEAKVDERKAIKAANERRESCDRRHGEYCSPSNADCRCYLNGRCVEATLPENLKTYNKES